MPAAPAVDAERVIADLRELGRRTGGPEGARRVCWTPVWQEARAFLAELLGEIGLEPEPDEAGNLWAYLEGEEEPALTLGSHLDSVPAGGWLDGALGVMGALGVVRAWTQAGTRPPRSLGLVDWADEEGARFGRSLFGSSAFAGTLEVDAVRGLRDRDGVSLPDALAGCGVELDRALDAAGRRERVHAYLELHIEQGPVLEAEGLRAAAVGGCVGIERHLFTIRGEPAHAGTTPMDRRHDAGLAAADAALRIEEIARRSGGVATTGALELRPGIATAVAGEAQLTVDLRHAEAGSLERMLDAATEAVATASAERGCQSESGLVWRIEPTSFDPALVAAAREACRQTTGAERELVSGALHDAAEVARVVPAAMIFSPSAGGISHSPAEDTAEEDLAAAVAAFGGLANRALLAGG